MAADVKSLLSEFRQSHPDVRLAAFIDVPARMVLGTSARVTRNQEIIDQLAKSCHDALAHLKAAPELSTTPVCVMAALPGEISLMITPAPDSDEALVVLLDQDAKPALAREAALGLAARVFETEANADR